MQPGWAGFAALAAAARLPPGYHRYSPALRPSLPPPLPGGDPHWPGTLLPSSHLLSQPGYPAINSVHPTRIKCGSAGTSHLILVFSRNYKVSLYILSVSVSAWYGTVVTAGECGVPAAPGVRTATGGEFGRPARPAQHCRSAALSCPVLLTPPLPQSTNCTPPTPTSHRKPCFTAFSKHLVQE